MDAVLRHFRDRAAIRNITLGVTASYQLLVGNDPMRYAMSVWNDPSIDLTVLFGEQVTLATGQLHIPAGMGPVFLSEDVIGDLMNSPVWVKSATAGPTSVMFTTISYSSDKYEQMRRYVHGCLSEYGAL
jgi:hypothetical protein